MKNNFINIGKIAKEGMTFGIKHKVILWLTFASILSTFAFQPLNMYWSPRLNNLAGDKIWLMGWIWAGISLAMMVGSILVQHFLKKEKTYLWISVVMVFLLALPILMSSISNMFYVVLIGFLTYEIGRGIQFPVQKSYLNKYTQSENRATVLSFNSMVSRVGAGSGLLIFGLFAKNSNIQISWLISGLLLLFLIPLYLRVGYHEKKFE